MTDALPVEDVLSRQEQKAQPMYVGRVHVHPKQVSGPNAPSQALLVDLPNRRFYVFWLEIWPQEVYYLTGLLILGAIGLFLATSIGGRVWCGYTCPQTVWTDLFLWVERLIEGDRNARIRLDAAPMSLNKAAKRAAKHAA